MGYQFDLKRSQLLLLLAGLVFLSGMLFLAGMLIGARASGSAADSDRDNFEPLAASGTGSGVPPATDQSAGATPAASVNSAVPSASATTPPPANLETTKRIYELQLGAFLTMESAQPVVESLSASNLQAYIVEATDSRDRKLYTVRLGPWDSMAEAAEAARTFREHSEFDGYDPVIRHRPKPISVGSS